MLLCSVAAAGCGADPYAEPLPVVREACVMLPGADHPGPHRPEIVYAPARTYSVSVDLGLQSACDPFEAVCAVSVVDGEIEIQTAFEERSAPSACALGREEVLEQAIARCELPPLDPGTYVVRLGEASQTLVLPSESPVVCVEDVVD